MTVDINLYNTNKLIASVAELIPKWLNMANILLYRLLLVDNWINLVATAIWGPRARVASWYLTAGKASQRKVHDKRGAGDTGGSSGSSGG